MALRTYDYAMLFGSHGKEQIKDFVMNLHKSVMLVKLTILY